MKAQGHCPSLRPQSPPNHAAGSPPPRRSRDILIAAPLARSEPPPFWSDDVRLAAETQEAQRLRAQIASLPDVRRSVVTGLREEIQTGAHSIDPLKIADELLREFSD